MKAQRHRGKGEKTQRREKTWFDVVDEVMECHPWLGMAGFWVVMMVVGYGLYVVAVWVT